MPAHPAILNWEGNETIAEAKRLIDQRTPLELQLPPDLHFALFSRLCAEERNQPESVEIEGGPELLEQIAQISALAALADLVVPLREAGAGVRVISPSPAILIDFKNG
ncbi:hypothetical protein [Thiohalobacter thiocyanaticus]|uniref:Uncharacterized protein n=1 Tax=Thiohalobacter thiocyanaticus TaxID=585455 RepID=A0A426QG16_9GAMM|nr:hypothetical protein [Thiohalobacter thiocyanaticus]RRQ20688.1 hypothetical protein D6C00_00945 [Thiohalobacter thiocyanaticus]